MEMGHWGWRGWRGKQRGGNIGREIKCFSNPAERQTGREKHIGSTGQLESEPARDCPGTHTDIDLVGSVPVKPCYPQSLYIFFLLSCMGHQGHSPHCHVMFPISYTLPFNLSLHSFHII